MTEQTNESKTTIQIAQAMFDDLFPKAAEIIAAGQEHAPMIFIHGGKIGKGAFLVAGFDKDTIGHLHVKTAEHPDVVSTCLVMEAWQFKGEQEKDGRVLDAVLAGQIQVRDLPEREETLMFNIRVGREQFLAMCKIDRQANTVEKSALIDLNHLEEGAHFEGRFIGDGDQEAQRARRNAN